MNMEQRLDRVERILKLAIRAGNRERREWRKRSRELDEKINIAITAHLDAVERMDKRAVEMDARLAKMDERAAKMDERAARTDERIDKLVASQARFGEQLAASQARFDERIDKLLLAQDNSDKKIDKLAEEHAATERSLKAFIDGLRKGQNWNSSN